MQKVLVAGCSGYLGSFTLREFKRRGFFVRAFARDPAKIAREGPNGEPAAAPLADEVFIGDVTDPSSLEGLCDGIDIVFSSLGRASGDRLHSMMDIDYRGNLAILEQARAAGVKKFVYVSIFKAEFMMHLEVTKAHERFVDELRRSGIDHTVVRPNAYFSDMAQFLVMARSGRMFWPGDGKLTINPIHGADLAGVCVDASSPGIREIDVGGPDVFTYRELFTLAFTTLGKPPNIIFIPLWLVRIVRATASPFSKPAAEMLGFAIAVSEIDNTAPKHGRLHLKDFFEEVAARDQQ